MIHIALADLATRSWVTSYQRLVPVDVPILADTAVALPALVARPERCGVDAGTGQARDADLRAKHEALRQAAEATCERSCSDRPIASPRLAAEVWQVLRGDDWVLANGTLDGPARRLWEWTRPEQYVGGSGGAGLGYGAGASIGVALAHQGTGKVCVNLQPDGDLLSTPSAIWTAAHHRIPLLNVICNNHSYYNEMLVAQARRRPVENRVVGIRIEDPPVGFAGLARAFGSHREGPVEDPALIGPALRRALRVVKEERRPAVVDVVIRPE